MTWGIPLKMAARKLRKTVTFISALLAWIQNNPSSTHKLIWEAQGESVCEQVQRALPASQQEEPLLALTRLKTLLKEPGAAAMRRRASWSIGVPPFLSYPPTRGSRAPKGTPWAAPRFWSTSSWYCQKTSGGCLICYEQMDWAKALGEYPTAASHSGLEGRELLQAMATLAVNLPGNQ
jgi:hypothetical protein